MRARPLLSLLSLLLILSLACNLGSSAPTAGVSPVPVQSPAPATSTVQPGPEALLTPTMLPTQPAPFVQDGRLLFASFELPPLAALQPPASLSQRTAWEDVYVPFLLAPEQVAALQQNGIVVSPGQEKEFFSLYERARYGNVPIFVTSDAMLHSYHLLFDKVLRTAEEQRFIPLLRGLNAAMLAESERVYQQLIGSDWEADALRLVAFFAVGSRLLDAQVAIPAAAAELAEAELALVQSAAGINLSPLFPSLANGEDYTQYIPRGHYTRSEALKAYFRSMMWYGRMTFLLQGVEPELGRADTRAAVLLVYVLRTAQVEGRGALEAWLDLYTPTVFFVGRSDDLTALQYGEAIDAVYGDSATLEALADEARLDAFLAEAAKLPPPRILGLVITDTENPDETTKGMRFMGQRFVPDAYIFRQLIYRNVGTREQPRALPMGLDVPAAMGSQRAYDLLVGLGQADYENFNTQMDKMRAWTAGLTQAEWTETLYNTWLYSFYPLLEPAPQGAPYFMHSLAWQDKQLNTVLGSWAELKHDTILYAKQVYAELGGGPPPPEPLPPLGYVEPVPVFYAHLSALTRMTLDGLGRRGLLEESDADSLLRLANLSDALQVIAEKELNGQPLDEGEQRLIRYIGGELEHFVMASADTDNSDPFAPKFMEEEPQAAVIADVATNPAGLQGPEVLEVGVGRVHPIYVVVPVLQADGRQTWQVALGGVFSYYEFAWPASDRLTDEKWRAMLQNGSAPPLPVWTQSFRVAAAEYEPLRLAIFAQQKDEIEAFWTPSYTMEEYVPALRAFSVELQQLRTQVQYQSHRLLAVQFLSYDPQAAGRAVVTVRETWQDSLHAGEWPDEGGPTLGVRGPYTRLTTYTLEWLEERWQVTIVSFEPPPAWQQP